MLGYTHNPRMGSWLRLSIFMTILILSVLKLCLLVILHLVQVHELQRLDEDVKSHVLAQISSL